MALARRPTSSCAPRSKRRVLLYAAGTRNSPALSPLVRTGCRALGSRVKLKPEIAEKRGRSHAPIRGVRLNELVNDRCVSTPTSLPRNVSRSCCSRRPIVVESPYSRRSLVDAASTLSWKPPSGTRSTRPALRHSRVFDSDGGSVSSMRGIGTVNVKRCASLPANPERKLSAVGLRRRFAPAKRTVRAPGMSVQSRLTP